MLCTQYSRKENHLIFQPASLYQAAPLLAAANEQWGLTHNLPRRFTLLPAGPSHVAAAGPAQSRRSLGQRAPVAPPPPHPRPRQYTGPPARGPSNSRQLDASSTGPVGRVAAPHYARHEHSMRPASAPSTDGVRAPRVPCGTVAHAN
jgi:hypothetical protein